MGQNVDFWLLSKNNTGRLPLRGILPVTNYTNSVSSRLTYFSNANRKAFVFHREQLMKIRLSDEHNNNTQTRLPMKITP